MSDYKDPNLFSMLGSNLKLRKTKDPQDTEEKNKKSKSKNSSIFLDEEASSSEPQFSPRWVTILSMMIAVIAIAGLGALAYGLWGTQPEQAPQMMIPVAERETTEEQKKIEESKKTIRELQLLVEGYLGATTIEEKLTYVRHPERVRPLMVDWYERQKHPMEDRKYDSLMTLVPKVLFAKSFWKAEMNHGGMFKKQLWIQSNEDGWFAIDWESDVVYNPIHWDQFLAEKPTTPVTLRVYIGWNDLYLYQHRDEEKFQSFKLESRDSDQTAAAYMKRDDPGVATMMYFIQRSAKDPKNLRTSLTLPFLVTLKYDESPEGKKNLVIEKLVSPSWIVLEDE